MRVHVKTMALGLVCFAIAIGGAGIATTAEMRLTGSTGREPAKGDTFAVLQDSADPQHRGAEMSAGWKGADGPGDEWDAAKADDMIGKLLLVGLTYVDPAGEVTEQVQVFGHVASADPHAGITLVLAGKREGERFNLPPSLDAFEPAREGIYRLRSTGEEVVDPDLVASFTVTRRAPTPEPSKGASQ